jgi:hypothetical protein
MTSKFDPNEQLGKVFDPEFSPMWIRTQLKISLISFSEGSCGDGDDKRIRLDSCLSSCLRRSWQLFYAAGNR